jgi:lysophospholipase L1-like esterase
MIDCIVLGDSIAVGTHLQRYECKSYSKAGINSSQWNKMHGDKNLAAGAVIISLGTNDHKYVKTEQELLSMRSKVKASKVFWIMPPCNDKFCKTNVNDIVKKIAEAHGDIIIGTNRVQADGIHPSWVGYREIANQTKEK